MWKVTDIVNEVSKRTEHRADTKIDLRMEFFLGLDEFVIERHFWWRQKRSSFTTVIGFNTYDLSATNLNGTIQPGGAVPDFAELDEAILLQADGVTKQLDLVPLIDPIAQLQAINNNIPDVPSGYFIDVQTSLSTLVLGSPASVAQKIFYTYWAIPQITDVTTENIPLIPPPLHWGLTYMLERRVYEFLYGQEDPRFEMANGRYEQFVLKSARVPHWSGKKVRELACDSRTVHTTKAWGDNGQPYYRGQG